MAQESRDTGSNHNTGNTLPDVTGDAGTLTKNILRAFSICAIVGSGLFILASFFPNSFLWGVNHLAFVNQWERIIIIVLVVSLGLPALSSRYLSVVEHRGLGRGLSPRQTIPVIAVFAALATLLFYSYPLATDLYGDTRTLISLLMEKKYSWIDIFSLSDREPLTRFIHQFLGDSFHTEYTTIYETISAVCGGSFIAATLVFARSFREGRMWKLLVLIFLLTSGAIQQFFCHIEDYTIIYVWLTIFFMVAWKFFDGKNMFALMIIMFLVGTRLHAEMVLVFPAVIFAFVYHIHRKYSFSDKWLRPAHIILFVGISLVFLSILYFFYFHADHYDTGDQQEVLTKIFLPLTAYQPPPFHYSLFSLDHLSDVLQQILLTVSPAALAMLVIGVVFRKSIRWNEPYTIFLGLSIFYFLLFNVSFHPMLSMPRDWDLLSLASVPVTFLAVIVSKKIFKLLTTSQIQKTVVGLSLALGLFSWTFIYVNGSTESASRRLEGVGRWAFKSYHAGSAYILNVSAKMIPDPNEQIKRREQTIKDLLPYASATDFEINFLYHKLGVAQYAGRQFENAMTSFTEALRRDPENASAIRMLGLIAVQTRNFEEASKIFSFYNKRINSPKIVDPRVLEFEYSCNQLKKLVSSGVDSTTIEHKLDVIFQETK